jgi:hypothetical protein
MSVERRAAERIPVNLNLTCRIPASPCRGTIHDISHLGCKLEVPGKPIELGGTALMELPGAANVTGRVVWIHGKTAGIRFERSLGKAAAIAVGLEQPEPVDNRPLPIEKNRDGLLRHWFRRLSGVFS